MQALTLPIGVPARTRLYARRHPRLQLMGLVAARQDRWLVRRRVVTSVRRLLDVPATVVGGFLALLRPHFLNLLRHVL